MGKEVVQISSSHHILMLGSDGKVYGVGENYFGQLGDGSDMNHKDEPVTMKMDGILLGKRIVQVSACSGSSLLLDSDGCVYGVGSNKYGQLGDGTTEDKDEPVAMKMDLDF